MVLRRIFLQIGVLGGGATFAITLGIALLQQQSDFLSAVLRAFAAGAAVLVFTLLIYGIVEKLGGPQE